MDFLDLRTISFVLFWMYLTLGTIFIFYAVSRKRFPGTLQLGMSLLLVAVTFGLFSLQNIVNPFISVVTATTVLTVALWLTPYGFRLFFESAGNSIYYYLFLTAVSFAASYYFVFIFQNHVYRLIIFWAINASIFLETSLILFYANSEISKFIRSIAAFSYFFLFAIYALRIILILISPESSSSILVNAVTPQQKSLSGIFLILNAIASISVYSFFIIMTNIKLELELKKYAAELEMSNATKNKFFSIISHDLKGPIGSMSGLLDAIINENKIPAEYIEDIKLLKSASNNTLGLLLNLLEWSKSHISEIRYNPEKVNIYQIINNKIKVNELKIKSKNIAIKNIVPENLLVFADVNMIMAVFRNLISNALKYTPENGCISFSAETENNNVIIRITDSGIGMSAGTVSDLFKINDMSHIREGTDGEIGSGIGLIICKEFIEKNAGTISAESQPGKGSSFKLTLPKGN